MAVTVLDGAGDTKYLSAIGAGTSGDPYIYQQSQYPFGTVACGELQGAVAATQLPTVACKMVRFKALLSNVGNVYLGGAAVTAPDGVTDVTTGLEIGPGDDTGWIPASNLNLFYRICNNAGDDLTYLALT